MPAIDALQALFQTQALGETVKRFASMGETNRVFAKEFDRGETITAHIGGDTVGWHEKRFSRGIAKVTGKGTPSEASEKPKATARAGTLLTIKEHEDLPQEWLYLIQNPSQVGDVAVDNARRQVADVLLNLSLRIGNAKEFIATKAFEGSLDLSAMPNSDLSDTLTYPVLAIAELNAWQTDATLIRSDEIPNIRDRFSKSSMIPAARAVATKETESDIFSCTELQAFLSEGSMAARALENSFLEGGAVPVFGGLRWTFTNSHYALDATEDTTANFLTTRKIIILPSEANMREIVAVAQGWTMVPTGANFNSNPNAWESLHTPVLGDFAYVGIMPDGGIRLFAGSRYLPIIKMPNGTAVVTTT